MSELRSMVSAATDVAANIRTLRARQGLSMGQLAARAGMSKGTLSKLESGDGNPTLDTLAALASALSVPLAYGGRELFSAELARAVSDLVARYHDATAPGGRSHRLVVVAHPLPQPPRAEEPS